MLEENQTKGTGIQNQEGKQKRPDITNSGKVLGYVWSSFYFEKSGFLKLKEFIFEKRGKFYMYSDIIIGLLVFRMI